MKCFESLVMAHINTIIPETLDPLQFAYRPDRSTDEAISISLHTALSHLDKRKTYVRLLFIDYHSAFNTNSALNAKDLGMKYLPLQLDHGLPDGLPPGGKGGNNTSATPILNTDDPQGCMLSPLLHSLF